LGDSDGTAVSPTWHPARPMLDSGDRNGGLGVGPTQPAGRPGTARDGRAAVGSQLEPDTQRRFVRPAHHRWQAGWTRARNDPGQLGGRGRRARAPDPTRSGDRLGGATGRDSDDGIRPRGH